MHSRRLGQILKIEFPLIITCLSLGLISITAKPTQAQMAAGKSKFLGNVIDSRIRETTFKKYWNQVTPGNAGKWGSVEGTRDTYNWTTLDNIYNYSVNNNLLYKHHTLIWGQQQPSWISTLDSASQREEIEEWIRLVGERYPQMDFVDVVNEPINAPPDGNNNTANYIRALGGTGRTGFDWLITAFQLARQYCPAKARLILNEYNVLHDNGRTDLILRIIDTLRVRGLIDAIAIQGHYFEFKGTGYTYSLTTIKNNLNRLVSTGLPVYISEFDINEPDDNVQLQNYQTYFPIFWENPGVKGITLWGWVQGEMWKADAWLISTSGAERLALQWLKTYVGSPIRPILLAPAKGTVNLPRNPTFIWSTAEDATSYHLQVATSSTFALATIVINDSTLVDTCYQADSLAANKAHYWRVRAKNDVGYSSWSDIFSCMTGNQFVTVQHQTSRTWDFALKPNYPNPFNSSTTIEYQLPYACNVLLKVYDTMGRLITTLVAGRQSAGYHKLTFQAGELNSGVYLLQLQAGNLVTTHKLLLIK